MKRSGFLDKIDKQIEFNQDKNIFLENLEIFKFAKETVDVISKIDKLKPNTKFSLIDYTTDKAIEEFHRVNQYYSFDIEARSKLKNIYTDLIDDIQLNKHSIEDISNRHYEKLRNWIKESNSFAEKIYKNADEKVTPVACFEYTPELQISILKIDINTSINPFLDIGCGANGRLVNYLKDRGIDAHGIDRNVIPHSSFETADWLEYKYGKDRWGTIVSNLGFSNHFNHHNLREDGNYIEYGKTYMNILQSLKIGGSFHYAPDLPFIEEFLDYNCFTIAKYDVDKNDFKATVVKRIK
ncbi:MAG: class I SAM-dependent methyltransferase [Bacteroidales bacterium]|nr:class I SAM-dependent methyltransferase [Bacteroidales bacterium]